VDVHADEHHALIINCSVARILDRWQPRRVIELAAGSGRVTIPLARAAAARGTQIVGLELQRLLIMSETR
jgi:hypothetical protein